MSPIKYPATSGIKSIFLNSIPMNENIIKQETKNVLASTKLPA
jgi:hypothetical protein